MLISFHLSSKQFKLQDEEDYILSYNFAPQELTLEEKQRSLAQLNFLEEVLNKRIKTDSENSWQWEIKLKSITFSKSRLLKDGEIEPTILTDEEKRTLEKESTLLNLTEYGQKTGTDPSTVSSIKSKMALYRKHRKERA